MESIIIKLKIERSANNEKVNFVIPGLENILINITDSNTDDIEKLFNLIFQKVIDSHKIIQFELEDSKNDLFYELAQDLVIQLNNEIKNSESDFEQIINMKDN